MTRKWLIRQQLLWQRDELLAHYHDAIEHADEEFDSLEIEEGAAAAKQWDGRVVSLFGDADVRQLRDVVAAMGRLDDGSYGTCNVCGCAMDEDLLTERPAATCCVDCAVTIELAPSFVHEVRMRPTAM